MSRRETIGYLFFFVGLILNAIGCASAKLVDDPVIPAATAGYPTLEFQACGNTFHGQGTCYIREGSPFNSIDLKIQGYFSGTGRVVSQACNLDRTFTYKDSELIKIHLPNSEPTRPCVLNMTLSPEYPKEWRSGIEVYSLIGVLAVRLQDGLEEWTGHTRKLTGNWKSNLHLTLGPKIPDTQVVILGCGPEFNKYIKAPDGDLYIPLEEAALKKPGQCVAEGVAMNGEMPDQTFSALISQYATQLPNDPKWKQYGFGPLPIPVIQFFGNDIVVTGSDQVSVVGVDDDLRITNKGRFKFDQRREHIVRLITVKGRSVVGVWIPRVKEFQWMQ